MAMAEHSGVHLQFEDNLPPDKHIRARIPFND